MAVSLLPIPHDNPHEMNGKKRSPEMRLVRFAHQIYYRSESEGLGVAWHFKNRDCLEAASKAQIA